MTTQLSRTGIDAYYRAREFHVRALRELGEAACGATQAQWQAARRLEEVLNEVRRRAWDRLETAEREVVYLEMLAEGQRRADEAGPCAGCGGDGISA